MAGGAAPGSLAVQRRRQSRREEWVLQTKLAERLARYLDPRTTFWSGVENAPRGAKAGHFQRLRGVRSGLADVLVLHDGKLVCIELKSKRGVPSAAQRAVSLEIKAAGGRWWLARSVKAALTALAREGVPLGRWRPPVRLQDWEGPFSDPQARLPQHPRVAAERRAAQQRCRARQRAREIARRAEQPSPATLDPQPAATDAHA